MNSQAQTDHERLVEQDLRRNMLCFAGWEFLWGFGTPFAMYVSFAPAYLGALGSPKWLIGLVISYSAIFSACQIIVSYLTAPHQRLRVYRTAVTASLVPWVLYSVIAVIWGQHWPPLLHASLYALAMMFFVGACNAGSSTYWEMMADNVPPRRRGLLFGLRTAGLGGSGLIMGYVASKVLAHWPTPLNFQISFIIGSSIFLTSCLTLWGIRDHVNPEHSQRIGTSGQPFLPYLFEMVRRLWQEPNYRILLFFLVLLSVATNGAAFIVAAAREQLGVTTQVQGFFSLIYLGTTAGLGWVLGIVADRYGYRLVTCLTSGMLSVAFLLCLLSQNVVLWCLAYGAFALACGSTPMVLCNMSAELCPEVPPSRLMGVGNVLVVSFVMIASTVCGAVVDLSGVYQPIFIANLMLSMIALFGFAFLVREPRTGQRYIIKVLHRD